MEIKLERRPMARNITATMPDGSSEKVKDVDVVSYLTRKGVRNPEKVFDYVWQFYKAIVVTREETDASATR